MKTILFCMATLFAFNSTTNITGTWNVVSPGSSLTSVDFRNNGIYNCYSNGQLILSGTYRFDANDSTLTIEDGGCFDVIGNYKVRLFGNADSLRFVPVSDDCFQRKTSIQSALLSRIKDN